MSHLSHHPLTRLPLETRPRPPLRPRPPATGERGGGAGRGGVGRGKLKKKKKKKKKKALRPGDGLHRSQRSTLPHPTTHMRYFFNCFALKMRWQGPGNKTSDSDKRDNRCTDATAQSGGSAPLLRPAKPPRLSKATGSAERPSSLFLCAF